LHLRNAAAPAASGYCKRPHFFDTVVCHLRSGMPVLMDSFGQRVHKPTRDRLLAEETSAHYRDWRFSGVSRGSDH